MQDRLNVGQDRCRTGMDAGQVECSTGFVQDRMDAKQVECRTEWMYVQDEAFTICHQNQRCHYLVRVVNNCTDMMLMYSQRIHQLNVSVVNNYVRKRMSAKSKNMLTLCQHNQ